MESLEKIWLSKYVADFTRVDPRLSKDGGGPSQDLTEWKTAEDWANHYNHSEIATLLKNHKEKYEASKKSESLKKPKY